MDTKRQTVCVTGVTGYIARQLVQDLLEQGYRVRGTVRSLNFKEKEVEQDFEALQKQYPGRLQLFEANLLQSEKLEQAIRGCNGVFHIASPVVQNPKDPIKELIEPAVQGTLNVLKVTLKEVYRQRKIGIIGDKDDFRVVITSSDAAVAQSSVDFNNKHKDYVYTERDWNETATINKSPYPFSKVLAEQAATSFAESPEAKDVNLKVIFINPSLVIGPIFTPKLPSSCSVVADILSSSFPMVPNLHWNIVDVRDVSAAHIRALELPNAAGRYLLTNSGFWLHDMANYLSHSFPTLSIITRSMPNYLMYIVAILDSRINISWVRQHLGRELKFSNNKSVIELGLNYRSPHQTLLDCSHSLISHGIIQKKIEKNKIQRQQMISRAKKSLVIFGLFCAVVYWKRNFLQNSLTKLLSH